MKYVGIDVHKKMCQAAVLDDDGELLDEIRFPNDPEGIEVFAGKLTTFRDDVKAVVESTGNLWIQIHDRLEEHGFDVVLSNPGKTRLIAEAKVKTDNHNEPYISISSPSPSLSFNLSLSRGWHTTIRGSTPSSTIRPYEAHPYSSFGDGPHSVFQGDNSS